MKQDTTYQKGNRCAGRKGKRALCVLTCLLLAIGLLFAAFAPEPAEAKTKKKAKSKWTKMQQQYQKDSTVRELIFVKYKGRSKAELILYKKNKKNKWVKKLSCNAYVGGNGIDKVREGDRKTPTGQFTLMQAFGVKADPGSKTPYTQVTNSLYWCGCRDHYNQMIDVSLPQLRGHRCRGEHLIDYQKQYAYAMALDYNKEGVYGKGSAIFLHCYGYARYTLGCIAVSQKNMKKILRTCEPGTKICIYKK